MKRKVLQFLVIAFCTITCLEVSFSNVAYGQSFLRGNSGGSQDASAVVVVKDGGGYAMDKERAYWNGEVIRNADANSFTILDNAGFYAKDKNRVYYKGEVLKGANTNNFKVPKETAK